MIHNSDCELSITPTQTHTHTHTRPGINACYSAQMSKCVDLQVSCSGLGLLDSGASLSMRCCQMLLSLLPHALHVTLHAAVYLVYLYTQHKHTDAKLISQELAIYSLRETPVILLSDGILATLSHALRSCVHEVQPNVQ